MRSDHIFGVLDRDLACAVALGIVEHDRVIVNLESVTVLGANRQHLGTEHGWLRREDPLETVTHDYLLARRDVTAASVRRPGQTGWGVASAIKTRDGAVARAREARGLGYSLLAERGVLTRARQAGLKVLAVD